MIGSEYLGEYFADFKQAMDRISGKEVDRMVDLLAEIKDRRGRLFFLGVGGSAANCSHAVNDFRKICGMEAYAPTDNIAELTARTNDEGWETVFERWLRVSQLQQRDGVMVLSVGGGDLEKGISTNIVSALEYSRRQQAAILGIVSRSGGYTRQVADVCIHIPVISESLITPIAESLQAVIWHGIVNHPKLREV